MATRLDTMTYAEGTKFIRHTMGFRIREEVTDASLEEMREAVRRIRVDVRRLGGFATRHLAASIQATRTREGADIAFGVGGTGRGGGRGGWGYTRNADLGRAFLYGSGDDNRRGFPPFRARGHFGFDELERLADELAWAADAMIDGTAP